MVKFNCLLIAFSLSFFSIFLPKTEDYLSIEKNNSPFNFLGNTSINNSAIPVFDYNEFLSNLKTFDNTEIEKQFYSHFLLKEAVQTEKLHYLKVSKYLNISLNIRNIIYPFHSFL